MTEGALVPELAGVAGISVPRLLDAIALVETSGCETGLRVEATYLPASFNVAVEGLVVRGTGAMFRAEVEAAAAEWGCTAASCGVSRWQIQASECWRLGYRGPFHDLLTDEVVLPFVCAKLRAIARDLVAGKVPITVEMIAEAWNTGSARDRYTNPDYQKKVRAAYDRLGAGR